MDNEHKEAIWYDNQFWPFLFLDISKICNTFAVHLKIPYFMCNGRLSGKT